MAQEQTANSFTEETVDSVPSEETIEENNEPKKETIGLKEDTPNEEVIIEEVQASPETNTRTKKKKKPVKKRKKSFFRSLSPFEITTIVLGILVAIVLIAGFWYLYQSAIKSKKAIPKSGIVASDEDKSWMTRVVNANNGLSAEFAVATSAVTGAPGIQIDSRVTKETVNMLADLKNAVANTGEDVNILAGYASVAAYNQIYQARINDLIENQDYSYNQAVAAVNQSMRVPGTDEHSLGLLVNFGLNGSLDQEAFKNSQSYDWLKNNAWKYGFIERYPEGKDSVTSHAYDPTAFRYVGEDIAEQIYQDQSTLEEYNAAEAQRKAQEEAEKQAQAKAEAEAQAKAEAEDAQNAQNAQAQ